MRREPLSEPCCSIKRGREIGAMGRPGRSRDVRAAAGWGRFSFKNCRNVIIPRTTLCARSLPRGDCPPTTGRVQGFGCRPVASYPPVLRAGVRKPPGKEPAGGRVGGCRLWGFDRAAAWVGDALAGVVGVGSTIAVPGSSSRRGSTGRFWPDRRCKRWLLRRRGDGGAMPEARFPGGQQL
jgi:hypothetical protein